MNELLKRLAALEKIAERTDEQETELAKVRADIATAERDMETLKAENAELKRQADIAKVADVYKVDAELREKFIADKSKDTNDFVRAILDAKQAETTSAAVVQGGDTPNRGDMLREITEVVAVKMGSDIDLVDNTFRNASMFDIAIALTDSSRTQGSRDQIIERAMTTSDFPELLVSAGNRRLEEEFDAQPGTYQQWVKEVDVPDFRENKDIVRGVGGKLDRIYENGELQEKQYVEGAETWSLRSYGNSFVVTREMMINDDLGAFNGLLEDFAALAANRANGDVYDMLRMSGEYADYVMADGIKLFHADHKNLGTEALSSTALSNARTAMRKQVGIDGITKLNIAPAYLIVAPELEVTAQELLLSSASIEDNKNSGVFNPHYRSLQLIVDAELANATEWYLATDRRTLKVGYLAGTGRRPVLKTNTSSSMRTIFEGVFDFGTMAEDFRGLRKGK